MACALGEPSIDTVRTVVLLLNPCAINENRYVPAVDHVKIHVDVLYALPVLLITPSNTTAVPKLTFVNEVVKWALNETSDG